MFRAEAVVLRTWPVHEADLIVSLLTREAGKIKGIAKSAAKSRRRFGGALEPMTHARAQYVTLPRQELVRLDSLEILRSPLSDAVDPLRAAALAFYTEVLDEMLPEYDPNDAVFRLLLSVLEQTQVGRVWMPVTYFALWIVRLMGWMPDLRRCTASGKLFAPDEAAYWSTSVEGLFCEENRKLGAMRLRDTSRAMALRFLHEPVERFAEEPWPRSRAADLRRFAVYSLERHGEKQIRSARALERLGS